MKFRTILLAAAALGLAAPAMAIPVFDSSNYAQNILTAARTLGMINNQVRQLQNEAQSLLNDARNLTALPSSVVGELQNTMRQSQRLIDRAKGLAFDVDRADAMFAATYPEAYGASVTRSQLSRDARERWTNSLEALRTATQVQAQVATSLADDEQALARLVDRSQGASGSLSAIQATNQLLALQAQQSIQSQRLMIAGNRAAALEQARIVGADTQAREMRRRFMTSGDASYTPASVTLFR